MNIINELLNISQGKATELQLLDLQISVIEQELFALKIVRLCKTGE